MADDPRAIKDLQRILQSVENLLPRMGLVLKEYINQARRGEPLRFVKLEDVNPPRTETQKET